MVVAVLHHATCYSTLLLTLAHNTYLAQVVVDFGAGPGIAYEVHTKSESRPLLSIDLVIISQILRATVPYFLG